jgi:uncharacterized protein (DUF1778 family)
MPSNAPTTKDARLEIRISQAEKEQLQQAADQDARPLSNWIRDRLLKAAREELASTGKGRKAPAR